MLAEEIHKKYYPKVSDEVFNLIVAADTLTSNPTKGKLGKYAKWLLRLYVMQKLRMEDLYKAEKYLPVFDKLLKTNKLTVKDINQYPSLADMHKSIKSYLQRSDIIGKTGKYRAIKQNEAETLYEDEIFIVIHPKTRRASCLYGSGTEWCTASKKHNSFSLYNEQGKLYIIINKKQNVKYQFHFESDSYMDESDLPLTDGGYSLASLKKIFPTAGLMNFFLHERQNEVLPDEPYEVLPDKLFFSCIAIRHFRYGIIKENWIILPFEYDMVKLYCSGLFEITKNGKTELIYVSLDDEPKISYFNQASNISMKLMIPFDLTFMFTVDRSDMVHFLQYADKLFRVEHNSVQPNCIVANRLTIMMLSYIWNMPNGESINPCLLIKQIYEEMHSMPTNSPVIYGDIMLSNRCVFLIIDQQMTDMTCYFQYSEVLMLGTVRYESLGG